MVQEHEDRNLRGEDDHSGDYPAGRDADPGEHTARTVAEGLTVVQLGLYLILMNERRLSEGWAELRNAITSAQIIGLHRDGTIQGCDAYSTEYRRRLWSYLIHADST